MSPRAAARRSVTMLTFAGAIALVLLYALRGGGSYDSLIFQENGIVIWWILAIGVATGLLPRRRLSRPVIGLLAALTGYLGWTALSLIWTDSSELTYTEITRVLGYIGVVALVASALDDGNWRSALAGLGVGAYMVCVVAAGSRLAPSVFGHDHVDAVLHSNRLSVPFGYWNSVGAWGVIAAVTAVTWSAHDRHLGRRTLALGLVPIATLTVYLTYSRTGAIDSGIAVVAVVLLSRNRFTALIHALAAAAGGALVILAVRGAPQIAHSTGTGGAAGVVGILALAMALCAAVGVLTGVVGADRLRMPRRTARIATAIAAAAVVIAAVTAGPSAGRHAWDSFKRTPRVAATTADPTARLTSLSGTRYAIWRVTVHAFDAHPVLGSGAGTTRFYWEAHATTDESILDAHNIWLQNMGELGLPGLLLIIAVALAAVLVAARVRQLARRTATAGAAAAVLVGLVAYLVAASVDWMWESTALTVLTLAAVAAVGTRLTGPRPRMRVPVRIVIALVALAAGLAQLPGLLSTSAVRHSQSAEGRGDPNAALAWAQAAVDAEPWAASAYEQRALVRESAAQFGAAASDLRRAIAREPQNYLHWLLLARVETERGQLRAALRAYDHSRRLYPRADVFAAG